MVLSLPLEVALAIQATRFAMFWGWVDRAASVRQTLRPSSAFVAPACRRCPWDSGRAACRGFATVRSQRATVGERHACLPGFFVVELHFSEFPFTPAT